MVRTSTAWQSMLSGERGIWTLAPVLPTYSLSRGAPSASLGISPCRYLQSKFLNIIIFDYWFQEESQRFFRSQKRRGWDSNPCAREDKRFSRPPRYDHFATSPKRLRSTFCLGPHSIFSREQMIYYQNVTSLSMLIINLFKNIFISTFTNAPHPCLP